MKKKIINKRVNGDSEELHALKGFKVLAVGNGTIGEECSVENHADEREQRCC